MDTLRVALSISVPTLAVLIGILVNSSRLTDLRVHIDARLTDTKENLRADLRRVEEVLDARLKHLEEAQH
jgi:hypothetical protein